MSLILVGRFFLQNVYCFMSGFLMVVYIYGEYVLCEEIGCF